MFRRLLVAFGLAATAVVGCGGGGSSAPTYPGGNVYSSDKKAWVVVPAGESVAGFTVTPVTSTPATPDYLAGTCYTFAGVTGTLTKPVTLTISYGASTLPAGVTQANFQLYTIAKGAWGAVKGATVDTTAHTVSLSVTSLAGSTFGILGPLGGTFKSADGHASVTVPVNDGILTTPITVTPTPTANIPANIGNVSGSAYDFSPATLAFTKPVQISIAYSAAALQGGGTSTLEMAKASGSAATNNLAWVVQPGSSVSKATNSVGLGSSTFGTFGLLDPNIGGTVRSKDGNASVTIPNGASLGVGQLTVTPTLSSSYAASPYLVTGSVYTFGPTGGVSPSATITIHYDPNAIPPGVQESTLVVAYPQGQDWVSFGGSVNVNTHTITTTVIGLGTYGVMGPNPFSGTYDLSVNTALVQFDYNLSVDSLGNVVITDDGANAGSGSVTYAGVFNAVIGNSDIYGDPDDLFLSGNLGAGVGPVTTDSQVDPGGTWSTVELAPKSRAARAKPPSSRTVIDHHPASHSGMHVK